MPCPFSVGWILANVLFIIADAKGLLGWWFLLMVTETSSDWIFPTLLLRGIFWSTHLSSLSSSSWHILITCSHYSTTLKHSHLRKWTLIITVTACEIKFILSSHKCLSPEDPKTGKKDAGYWDEAVQNVSTNLNYDGPWSLSQLRISLTVKRRR